MEVSSSSRERPITPSPPRTLGLGLSESHPSPASLVLGAGIPYSWKREDFHASFTLFTANFRPSRERKEKQERALLRSVVLEERLLQLQQKAAQAPTSNPSTSMEIPCLDSCPLSADLRLQFASSSMELERT